MFNGRKDDSVSEAAPAILNKRQTPRGSLLIGGHSHVTALLQRHNKDQLQHIALAPDVFGLIGPFPRDDAYWRALAELGQDKIVLLSYGGNEHNAHFLCECEPRFDFVAADAPHAPLLADAQLVPETLVEARFAQFGAALREVLSVILSGRPRRVAVLGTPAPKGDEAHLRAALTREPSLAQRALHLGMSLDAVRFTPPQLRLKLWRKLQEAYARTAASAGCAFIPVPNETLDAEGFLRPDFYEVDATHANFAYGLVAREDAIAQARALA